MHRLTFLAPLAPRLLSLCLLALLVAGCAQWKAPPKSSEKRGLPAASVADEAAVLDIIFWPLPDRLGNPQDESLSDLPTELLDSAAVSDPMALLWREVDELAVSAATRESLAGNGLRAGRIDHIEQWMERLGLPEPGDAAEQLMQQASVASEIAHSRHRVPFRSGQQHDFAVRQTAAAELSVIVRRGEDNVGRGLYQPQFLITVQARPEQDGRIRIRTWPRVEHGAFRQSFVSSDQAIRMNSSRASWILQDLAIDLPLDQNQTLIIAPSADPFGLGKQMLTDLRPDGTQERVAVLIRLARKPEPAL